MSLIIRNLNCTCSFWFTYVQHVNQKLQVQLRFLMMRDITLETCWTINVRWNNKIPLLSCISLVIATSHFLLNLGNNSSWRRNNIYAYSSENKSTVNVHTLIQFKQYKRIMVTGDLRFQQPCCWRFRSCWMWSCFRRWGRHDPSKLLEPLILQHNFIPEHPYPQGLVVFVSGKTQTKLQVLKVVAGRRNLGRTFGTTSVMLRNSGESQ